MKKRPLSIVLLATLFLAIPFILFLAVMLTSHLNISQISRTWTSHHTLISMSSFVVGCGIWSVRPWGYFLFMLLSATGIGTSFMQYFRAPSFSSYFNLISLAALAGAVFYFLQRHIASPYFNPKERWWETAPRFRTGFINVDLTIKGQSKSVELIDISRTGCFVRLGQNLAPGDLVYLKVIHREVRLELLSQVVRMSENPPGSGLMFLDLTRQDRRELKSLLNSLQEVPLSAPLSKPESDSKDTQVA